MCKLCFGILCLTPGRQFILIISMYFSVLPLTSKNFNHKIGKKKAKVLWAVDYFAPWCGPCQQLAPEWTAVAKIFRSLPNIKIASVDCETESSLCGSQGVRSYPTIRLYPFGSEGLSKVA